MTAGHSLDCPNTEVYKTKEIRDKMLKQAAGGHQIIGSVFKINN